MSYKRISILAEEITDYIRFRRASGTKFVNQEDLMKAAWGGSLDDE